MKIYGIIYDTNYFCGIPSSCSNIADVSNSILGRFGVLSIERHPPETIPSHMTCLGGGYLSMRSVHHSATPLP